MNFLHPSSTFAPTTAPAARDRAADIEMAIALPSRAAARFTDHEETSA